MQRRTRQQVQQERVLIWVVIGIVVFMASVALVLQSPGVKRLLQPPPTPTPQATPGSPLLVNLVNQHQGLNTEGPYAFDVTTHTLRITYTCVRAGQINFAIGPMDRQQQDLAWAKQVTCPASGQDTVTVAPGTYSLNANDIEDQDIGWGLTIMQE